MHRTLAALAACVAVLLLPAAADAADTIAVEGGTLTFTADPAQPAVALQVGSRVNSACEFNLPDGKAYAGGPCLLFAVASTEGFAQRAVSVGAGCTAVGKDDAVCPLDGVSAVALRTGPHADRVDFDKQVDGFGRYYWIGTDDPIAIPVPLTVDLGAGDDKLTEPHAISGDWPLPGAQIRCGDGVDELQVGRGLRWSPDCETGDGQTLQPAGTSGGSLLRDGAALRFLSPRAPHESARIAVDTSFFRGNPVVEVSGPTPQELAPGCLVLGQERQTCPLDGVERVAVVAPRDQPASVDVEAPGYGDHEEAPGPPLPPVEVDMGAKDDAADTRGPAAQRISCGDGVDEVQASAKDEVEADCEKVKGGRRLAGTDLAIGRRSAWRRMPGNDAYKNRTFLTLTCPASARDDSCGGTVRLEYGGTRMGSIDYALARGERRKVDFFYGRGSVAYGGELARAYAAMRRSIRDRGGAKLKAVVLTGASTFAHPLTLTRIVKGGGRPA